MDGLPSVPEEQEMSRTFHCWAQGKSQAGAWAELQARREPQKVKESEVAVEFNPGKDEMPAVEPLLGALWLYLDGFFPPKLQWEMLDFVFKGVAGCGLWGRICERLFHQRPGRICFYCVSMATISRMPHVQVIRMLVPGVPGQEVSGDFVCLFNFQESKCSLSCWKSSWFIFLSGDSVITPAIKIQEIKLSFALCLCWGCKKRKNWNVVMHFHSCTRRGIHLISPCLSSHCRANIGKNNYKITHKINKHGF